MIIITLTKKKKKLKKERENDLIRMGKKVLSEKLCGGISKIFPTRKICILLKKNFFAKRL